MQIAFASAELRLSAQFRCRLQSWGVSGKAGKPWRPGELDRYVAAEGDIGFGTAAPSMQYSVPGLQIEQCVGTFVADVELASTGVPRGIGNGCAADIGHHVPLPTRPGYLSNLTSGAMWRADVARCLNGSVVDVV
jgi:hypothetical protein